MKLKESKLIVVTESGQYSGCFDRACKDAIQKANQILGSDGYGNMTNVEGWTRSTCYIDITFIEMKMTLGMTGVEYVYSFSVTPLETDD